MATLTNLTLADDVSVPSGVTLVVSDGNTLTVNTGKTLDLTGGSLALMNNATFTVNGTVNAKSTTSETSYGIVIVPGETTAAATINGSGIIHLTTPGILLAVSAGQKLTLSGTVILDGLTTDTNYPGTSIPYPTGIGGDPINNTYSLIFVGGELNMQGGTITGNYNSDTSQRDGGGVEINKAESGNGVARFTMSGDAKVSGNKAAQGGGGVNVCQGGTFIMNGGTVSGNSAAYAGGVRVEPGNSGAVTTFTMIGGTVYGSGEIAPNANRATGWGASLGKRNGGTAQYGNLAPIALDESSGRGTSTTLTGHN
ncbi:outer membrane autotransporter barrel domain protein [Treponema primitia ZAS-2]|uniref:Outer membrane autotransporter barrel domain protein n=1 Tax=Treponema primitia (strain ATCC BAA-887 / DSM 12427 / ZAS-2) TaxID=545694 RepID=F5YQ37_TREPZ|nr:hypothetical protein [Treponema primitia]AEF86644.1 outer membrane autotransporter barrel domain protein [Treponema primitia ZAS-2]